MPPTGGPSGMSPPMAQSRLWISSRRYSGDRSGMQGAAFRMQGPGAKKLITAAVIAGPAPI